MAHRPGLLLEKEELASSYGIWIIAATLDLLL